MDRLEWMEKRRQLTEIEKKERSEDWAASRAPLQAAVTEQAVRELFARVEAIEIMMGKKR